jgi:hypothetical protein
MGFKGMKTAFITSFAKTTRTRGKKGTLLVPKLPRNHCLLSGWMKEEEL